MQMRSRTVLVVVPLLLGGGCQGLIGELPPIPRQVAGRPADPAAPLPAAEALPDFEPAPLRARQLLRWQYEESVRVLLGEAAAAAVALPADVPLNGFTAVGASQLAPTPVAVRAWELSAHAAAEAAFAGGLPPGFVPCTPASTDDAACLGAFVRSFGRKAFRRPVTEEEVSTWTAVGRAAAKAYGRFDRGAQFVVAGMLQSPAFLYLAEVGEPDGAGAGRLRLTRYELAARLSYFLAGIPPPEALLAAAEAGALETADGLRAEARRLLALPSASRARAAFFDEWLELGRLEGLAKDPGSHPLFSPALAVAMRQETQAFLEDLVARGVDFRDFLDSPDTFVNADLARLYGIAEVPEAGFERRTYPASSLRGGVLGHASLMAGLAHPRLTSPTRRGRFVRERLLCQPVGAAPPGVNAGMFSAASEAGHVTMRERLSVHLQEPSCAGCHVLMDGIGLGLENYDAVGAFRSEDEGLHIDAVSTLDSLGTFEGSRQLGTLLRNHPRTLDCLTRNLFRVAVGRLETDGEARPLRAVLDGFAASGHRLDEVLVELSASDAFRFAMKEETP